LSARLERLFQDHIADRRVDLVPIVDRLLDLAREVGEIRCGFSRDRGALLFEIPGQEPCEVQLWDSAERNRSILRSACARLAKLREESGEEFLPYGGEGHIVKSPDNGHRMTWRVRYKNTMGEQEFVIIAE
jgi:hypothetical protein